MEIWGLTGGMASGKSTVAAIFRRDGVPVFDSDACVHHLQGENGLALPAIERAFPGVVQHNRLNRDALRARLVEDGTEIAGKPSEKLKKLEGIIHPLVARERNRFLRYARARRVPLVVVDVPLLWESGCDKICDRIMVTTAPLSLRLRRLMQRQHKEQYRNQAGMTEATARYLIARQLSDKERCRRADMIVQTGLSHASVTRQVKSFLSSFRHSLRR